MLAALIGGAAAGVPGALVATPLLGAAKSVWLDVVEGDNHAPIRSRPSESTIERSEDRALVSRFGGRVSETLTQIVKSGKTWVCPTNA